MRVHEYPEILCNINDGIVVLSQFVP